MACWPRTLGDSPNMRSAEITVRYATVADSRDLWLWRNDPLTRAMSKDDGEVSWEDHSAWFAKIMARPETALFIGEQQGGKIGMCRFDRNLERATCVVSINLNPDHRGRGLSTLLLRRALAEFATGFSGDFLAEIRTDNLASRQCFLKNGFEHEGEAGQFEHYRLSPPDLRKLPPK